MSKHTIRIEASTSGTAGQIRIVDFISMYGMSSAERIREIVDEFVEKGVASTEVYINSRGGSTLEIVEITNELARLQNVSLRIGALAASAGTYPMTKFPSKGYSNSQFMIHRPKLMVSGDVHQVKAELKALEMTTADFKTAYARKMGKTEEEIESLWKDGDYWMTAKEAKENGLLDEILTENTQITSEDVERLVACGCPTPPQEPKKTETKLKMENRNQIIAALKLPADATDAQIEAAVKEAQAKAEQVEALTAAQAEARRQEATAIVDRAILDKKITADMKEKYVKLAETDLDSTKAVLEAMPGLQRPTPSGNPADPTGSMARENWTLEDYQEKDPQALAKLAAADPEAFKKLNDAHYGN